MANYDKHTVKMSGYLEKKSKKMMSSWKGYWFVLEGHLLLYYKSKDEYDTLSPCKGSISLGPNCAVKPLLGTACVFEIETRTNTVALKARTRLEQEKWMQAILSALNQHSAGTNGMLHFRYSSDDLVPTRKGENKTVLSRQYTLPERLKLQNRNSFCRSFDTLRSHENRPKSAMTCGDGKVIDIFPRSSVMLENTEYCSKNDFFANVEYIPTEQEHKSVMVDNIEYCTVSKDDDPVIIDNVEYCAVSKYNDAQTPKEDDQPEEYYALTALNEKEKELLRSKEKERSEHIYERISGESGISCPGAVTDNDVYSTADESKRFLASTSSDDDEIVENDQYCTPDITVRDTELVSYHEYNVPEKDKHIYSVPNEDLNRNESKNLRSRRRYTDLNPYSVCQIYPKQRLLSVGQEHDAIYDNPDDFPTVEPHSGNVTKLLRKFCTLGRGVSPPGAGKSKGKWRNFLRKLFGRTHFSKKKAKEGEEVEEEDVKVGEEIEYAQVYPEVPAKKMDATYCIDRKLLAELEMILQTKKRKLEKSLGDKRTSDGVDESEEGEMVKGEERKIDIEIEPKNPLKPPPKNPLPDSSSHQNRYEKLQTIDRILSDLEEMKRKDELCGSNVKRLMCKFERTVRRGSASSSSGEIRVEDVPLRPKGETNRVSGGDELNRLLCELAKVTSAPLLKPGVTSSLGVTSKTDEEFANLIGARGRRMSEPDYDIPRPHANLSIVNDEDDGEDVLVATRFFGPGVLNYHSEQTECVPSITPDSLETPSGFKPDPKMASYTSHKYYKCEEVKETGQKTILKDHEEFVDSLENFNKR